MISVAIVNDSYELAFDYSPELVQFCRSLQRARYDPTRKLWTAMRNVPNAIDLRTAGYFDDVDVCGKVQSAPETKGGYEWTVTADPYQHQTEWAKWSSQRRKILLNGEMGVGKTLMSMLWLQERGTDPERLLVICPASLIHNWVAEFKKFTGVDAIAVTGSAAQRHKAIARAGIHVLNYEFFALNAPAREMLAHKTCLIMDESHMIKDPSSKRSKIMHSWCLGKDSVLLMTGTPVSQGAQDYYSQFRTIEPRLLGASFTAFRNRYCITEPIRGAPPSARRITGYQHLDELSRIIAPYTHTVLKRDCLKDLPSKIYQKRFIDLSPAQKDFYHTLKTQMAAYLGEFGEGDPVIAANMLTRMLRLSQVTQGFVTVTDEGKPENTRLHKFEENPKLAALKEILTALPDGESVVIMCRFLQDIVNVTALLSDLYITSVTIQGEVTTQDRQLAVERFQHGSAQALVGQIRSAGVGITLTKAHTMIFFSNDYSLINRVQAEDRIHRIGQTEKCNYIDIVARDTVDEHVITALVNKQNVADHLTELRLHFSS